MYFLILHSDYFISPHKVGLGHNDVLAIAMDGRKMDTLHYRPIIVSTILPSTGISWKNALNFCCDVLGPYKSISFL